MEQKKIDRINELARKSKAEGLTDEERVEQAQLRSEYIAAYRASLVAALEDAFDIMMDTDDIIDFNSYEKGMEILEKDDYGVKF